MAEYLAHVHSEQSDGSLFRAEPFDGLLYKSVQRKGGTNIVLFPKPKRETDNAFPVVYVSDSVKFFHTTTINYEHDEIDIGMMDGEIVRYSDGDETGRTNSGPGALPAAQYAAGPSSSPLTTSTHPGPSAYSRYQFHRSSREESFPWDVLRSVRDPQTSASRVANCVAN